MTALLGPVAADLLVGKRGLSRVQYDALVELAHHLTRHLPQGWFVRVAMPLAANDRSEPEPDPAVTRRTPGEHPRTAALAVEVAVTGQRTDLVHEVPLYAAAAAVEQCWVLDVPARQVVVHTEPGAAGYATARRLPWTASLSVLEVDVDLAVLPATG